MVLAGFVGGFGWFWLVPCFSNYGIFSPLSCSSHLNSHEKSKRALSLKTGQQLYFSNSN